MDDDDDDINTLYYTVIFAHIAHEMLKDIASILNAFRKIF